MKLVVPLTIPWTRSMWAPASDSREDADDRDDPGDGGLEAQLRRRARRAVANSSSPCWERSCLLAVTTWRPARSARRTIVARGFDAAEQLDDRARSP